jgi:hypothetical protein
MGNKTLIDTLAGGTLTLALLLVFLVDRLVSPPLANDGDPNVTIVRKSGTLLGDQNIVVRLKALGSQERLEKLKVVRLTAKASFARATNVNDVTFAWCWEPRITMRFVETLPTSSLQSRANQIELEGDAAREKLLQDLVAISDLNPDLASKLDREARSLLAMRNYRPFFNPPMIVEDKVAYHIFHDKLALPMKPANAIPMRNLFFALSVSNLLPIQRHQFRVTPGQPQFVNGKNCDQFTVDDSDGLKLQFFFDKETNLLAKIAHMGHNPSKLPGEQRQVFWEHYFSDYRETEGIKQWRKAQIDNDGQRFATLDVVGVEFFNEMIPELRRPGR